MPSAVERLKPIFRDFQTGRLSLDAYARSLRDVLCGMVRDDGGSQIVLSNLAAADMLMSRLVVGDFERRVAVLEAMVRELEVRK